MAREGGNYLNYDISIALLILELVVADDSLTDWRSFVRVSLSTELSDLGLGIMRELCVYGS